MFHQFWKQTKRNGEGGDQTESQCRQENPDHFTSESRILEMQRAERAVLTQHAERLCTAGKAQNDAVLERLGLSVHDVTLPSCQPPAFPRRSAKPSLREGRIRPLLGVPRLNMEDIDRNQKSLEHLNEGDDFFWDKGLPGSQLPALACKEARVCHKSPTASVSAAYSFSSMDTDTPRELRAIPLIVNPAEVPNFRPTPPRAAPLPRRRRSRLPVLSARLDGADKVVANGCRLQSAKREVEAIVERPERSQLDSVPSPRPPATAKSTPTVAPLAPTPPTVLQMKKKGTRPGTFLRPGKAVSGAGKKKASLQSANEKKAELQPLTSPVKSLSLCFKLLSSDDWMKKIDGLKTIQALVEHHSEILKSKLHAVCLVLIEEVQNLRSAVACAAMNVLAELYVHLQKAMDPEVEGTGRALLLKLAQTTNAFIHEQANLALDAMVQNCSHGRILSSLLNTGLSHRCVAVRGSMAQHLNLLVDSFGAARILTAGKSFTERFLIAVSKMCVDAAPEVRHYGQKTLQELALHNDFLNLWTKLVCEKERRPLDKLLKKAK